NGARRGSFLRSLCEGSTRSSLGNKCSLQHDGRDENVQSRSRLRRLSNRNVHPRPGGASLVFHMLDGVKSWKAKGPKEKLVPFFCSHHTPLRAYADLDDLLFYVVDGIVDVRFNPGFADRGLLVKQFRIRKMKGAPHETYWVTFQVTASGIVEVPLPVPVLTS